MKLIIFDMDGTLIDSGDVITNTINYVREQLGLSKIDKNTMLTQINNPEINSSEFFYGTQEFTPEQTKLFGEYYDNNCTKDIKLYAGIEQLLKKLGEKYILSIATNASSIFALKMLEATNINKYFNYVIGHDMVKNAKPSSQMIIKTMEKFDISNKNTILIGDSLKDYQSALNANIKPILVNWGFTPHKDGVNNTEQLYKKILEELEDK